MIHRVTTHVRRFLQGEDGPTVVEYAVMLALILVTCVVALGEMGCSTSATFSKIDGSMGGS